MRFLFVRHRFLLAAAILGATLAALAGLPRIKFDDNYRELFQTDTRSFHDYQDLIDAFGSDEFACLVIVEAPNVLSAEAITVVNTIHDQASKVPGVVGAYSILAARQPRRVGRYFLPVVAGDLSDPRELETTAAALREHPLVRGQLLSNDGRATLMVIQLDHALQRIHQLKPVVTQLRDVLSRATAGTNVSAEISGLPAIRLAVTDAVKRDNLVFALAGLSLAFLVAWYLFRRLATLLIVCAAPLTGIIWTLGLMGWVNEPLNVINVLVPTLILVIGFTDALHVMFHIIHERDIGASPQEAVLNSLRLVGPACILTCATTAIGFASLIAMDQPLLQRFGVTCAIGAVFTATAVLLIIPLLAGTRLGLACTSHRAGSVGGHANATTSSSADDFSQNGAWVISLIERVVRRPWLAVTIGIAILGAIVPLTFRLKPDFRYTENLPDQNDTVAALRKSDELFGGSAEVNVLVSVPSGVTLSDPQLTELLAEIHRALERQPIFSRPVSLLNLLQSLPGKSSDLSRRSRELRYLPDDVLKYYVNTKQRKLIVSARVPDAGSARLKQEFDLAQSRLADVAARYPGYELHFTGMPVLSTYAAQGMIPALVRCFVLDLPILVMMFIILRSVRLALISIIPNILPLLAAAAALAQFGFPLRYAAVMCFTICLGIAVDDTIHIMVLYRRELKRGGGASAAIVRAMRSIVPVVTTTNLLIMIGFGVAMLSSMPTLRLFGALACVILVLALLADLFLLPVLVCIAAPSSAQSTNVPPRESI